LFFKREKETIQDVFVTRVINYLEIPDTKSIKQIKANISGKHGVF